MVDKAMIIEMLRTKDRAIARALVALTARQTADEQVNETVTHKNGQGFRPCHARIGTSMSKFFEKNGYLSPKQVAYWRTPDRSGKMRIAIYANQLLTVVQEKSAGLPA
jgi:tRNA(Ile2) C34 agmatinyltransferase TiaS